MKLKLNRCVLLFLYVSLVTLANHFLQAKQGDEEMEFLSDVSDRTSHHMMKEENGVNPDLSNVNLKSLDQECENDEDGDQCLIKRRMTIAEAEAHLDYIYTQPQNP